MKILIIEDELPASRRLIKILKEILPNCEILDTIDSVSEAIEKIPNYLQIDLILMDIQLADGLSFDIFEHININFPIIFVTAYDEYALKAFKVNSIDYLLKPIDKNELEKSIEKLAFFKQPISIQNILKQIQIEKKEYKTRFLVKLGEKLIFVPIQEIAYFKADEKIVCLHTLENKKYFVDYSLDDLENILNPNDFFRLNRQFITQIKAIKNIHTYFNGKLKIELTPATDVEVLISREKNAIFKDWLGK